MLTIFIAIQTFFGKAFQTSVSLLRITLMSKWFVKLPQNKVHASCIVLGNGPSLNNSILNNKTFLSQHDLFAVNYFGISQHYFELKPRYYVFLAPETWEENPLDNIKKARVELFEKMQDTNWDIYFYIPFLAKRSTVWKKYFKDHTFIHTVFFNPTPIEGFTQLNHYMFKRNLGMPRPHNVLTPSIMFAISQQYENVYLLGADHSWLDQIWVDDNNNVLLTQKHFYDEKTAKAEPMNNYKERKTRKLHEILHKFMLAFKSYFELREYGNKRNVQIYNATPGSLIDAFERYKIS